MVSFVMFCFESTVLEDWHIDASLVRLRISETDYSLLLQFSSHILRGSSETFSAMQIRYLRSEIFLRTGYYCSSFCVLLMVQCRMFVSIIFCIFRQWLFEDFEETAILTRFSCQLIHLIHWTTVSPCFASLVLLVLQWCPRILFSNPQHFKTICSP